MFHQYEEFFTEDYVCCWESTLQDEEESEEVVFVNEKSPLDSQIDDLIDSYISNRSMMFMLNFASKIILHKSENLWYIGRFYVDFIGKWCLCDDFIKIYFYKNLLYTGQFHP